MERNENFEKQFGVKNPIIVSTIANGYFDSLKHETDYLILSNHSLFPDYVVDIVDCMKEFGIDKVAVTDSSSALMGILWEFKQHGCSIEMQAIDTKRKDQWQDPVLPGFVITLN